MGGPLMYEVCLGGLSRLLFAIKGEAQRMQSRCACTWISCILFLFVPVFSLYLFVPVLALYLFVPVLALYLFVHVLALYFFATVLALYLFVPVFALYL